MSKLSRIAVRNLHFTYFNARGPLRFEGWYPRDHKPGPYPKNDEERRIAAIKYGLRPEDYKPIDPSNVLNFSGDYPDLGLTTFAHKDPYEAWSDNLYRRNWGEMVPKDMLRYRPDRITFTGLEEEDFKFWRSIWLMMRILVPMGLLTYYFTRADPNCFRWQNPVMPKQYPYDFYRAYPFEDPRNYPIVNYTFEPAE
uniref:NADH dehydrogenase [ubiquinone] 1 beta subcomplex subunit 8, mitochondrial n=1 Tax=Strongyloides stercoralis TaxID=6248 RepID=A0A0K0E9F7_STRER